MNTKIRTISSIVILTSLAACGNQPTEMQKAQIEQQLISCLTAVTTQVGSEPTGIFGGLSSMATKIGSDGDLSKTSWKIIADDPETINMSFDTSGTNYSCDYALKTDSPDYQLLEARRNKEVVYNLIDENNAIAENKRLAAEKLAEQIKIWTEKSWAGESYKYYQKYHLADDEYLQGQALMINCAPTGMRFGLAHSFKYSEKRNHPIVFLIDGERVEKTFDISDRAQMGVYADNGWSGKSVRFNQEKQNEFMALFVKSDAIFVDGFEYHVDDLSQIPCMESK